MKLKIAVITDDGWTVSQHFGRAPYCSVFEINEGEIVSRDLRDKMCHSQFAEEEHSHHHDDHAGDEIHHHKHEQMAGPISDCEVLICGGMGRGAYESIRLMNIKPIVTDLQDLEAAVQAYINGTLADHIEKLH